MKRLRYDDIKIDDLLKVRVYDGGLTDTIIEGRVTNKDGQNVMLNVFCYFTPEEPVGRVTSDYEAFNPDYARAYKIEENTRI